MAGFGSAWPVLGLHGRLCEAPSEDILLPSSSVTVNPVAATHAGPGADRAWQD